MKPLIVLLGLLGLGGFSWASWNYLHTGIAQSLTSQAQKILDDKGANATVSFDHLDGVIRGVASEEERSELRREIESTLPVGRIVFTDEVATSLSDETQNHQAGVRDLSVQVSAAGTSADKSIGLAETATGAAVVATGLAANSVQQLADNQVDFVDAPNDALTAVEDGVETTLGNVGGEASAPGITVEPIVTSDALVVDNGLNGRGSADAIADSDATEFAIPTDSANELSSESISSTDAQITTDLDQTPDVLDPVGADQQFDAGNLANNLGGNVADLAGNEVADAGLDVGVTETASQSVAVDFNPIANPNTVELSAANGDAGNTLPDTTSSGSSLAADTVRIDPIIEQLSNAPLSTSTETGNSGDVDRALSTLEQGNVSTEDAGVANGLGGATNLLGGVTNGLEDGSSLNSGTATLDGNPVVSESTANPALPSLNGSLYPNSETITSDANSTANTNPALNTNPAPATGSSVTVNGSSLSDRSKSLSSTAADLQTDSQKAKRVPPRLGIYMSAQQRSSLVRRVEAGSAAAEAGVRVGDRVIAFGGLSVGQFSELVTAVKRYSAGDQVEIVFERNGQRFVHRVTLKAAPATPPKSIIIPKR